MTGPLLVLAVWAALILLALAVARSAGRADRDLEQEWERVPLGFTEHTMRVERDR